MNKTETLKFRVTKEEKEIIKRMADETGLNLSNYIRRILLDKRPSFLSKEERDELFVLRDKAIEITRTLNLYHEQRKEHTPFLHGVKKYLKKQIKKL